MKRKLSLLIFPLIVLTMCACSGGAGAANTGQTTTTTTSVATQVATPPTGNKKQVYAGWPETFEAGSKGAYGDGAVTLATGVWDLDNALIGSQQGDGKNGAKSARIAKTGTLTMTFDVVRGASEVTIQHAVFGKDGESTWGLWYSTDGGNKWTQTGDITTTSSATLSAATYTMCVSGNVRFQLRKLTGGRLNIDDFSITSNGSEIAPPAQQKSTEVENVYDDNMAMGNPSGATANATNQDNYLMVKHQYALSYNNSKGIANWVSWHLSKSWLGAADRCNCFEPDATLPVGYLKVVTSNYSGSGFDRGHLCPSGDRTCSDTDNARTFLMTNMTPQAPNMNEVTWEAFEEYCRKLAAAGNELYIIAGGTSSGGNGRNGGTTNNIDGGKINVPSHFWKIAVILPEGTNDVNRITTQTRVIAIDMPNTQAVSAQHWDYYRTSVDAIERFTGYDFLSNVSTSVQAVIESHTDNGPTR